MSFIFRKMYDEPGIVQELAAVLAGLFPIWEEVVFLCVGTDKNILDCLGPLVGTMVKEKAPDTCLYGTLDDPLHARNLVPALREIRARHPGAFMVAIDASLGRADEVGLISIKEGSLFPGKALNKTLPAIGNMALTGTVATYHNPRSYRHITRGSISPVYHMARVISQAIYAIDHHKG